MRKIFLVSLFLLCLPFCISAQHFSRPALLFPYVLSAPEINARAAVVIDIETGALLFSKNPDLEIPPASLTKLMTMHLVMKEIDAGRASYGEIIPITVESWARSQPPRSSLMFLAPGQIVTLREIMLGLAISSGNDAAVAAALRFAPTMQDFASLMTIESRRMGLSVTRFVESSDISEYNYTTAAEFAHFCRQYIALYPHSLQEFHSVPDFAYPLAHNVAPAFRHAPGTIPQSNRNNLLRTFPGVDGLKTGFINESGYNIALTAERGQTRFIAVILGAGSTRERDTDGTRLLTWAFDNFRTVRPVIGNLEKIRLWKGRANEAEIVLSQSASFTSPSDRAAKLIYEVSIPVPVRAPLPAGAAVGHLIISDENGELHRVPVLTANAYERGNIFKRMWHSIVLFFQGLKKT